MKQSELIKRQRVRQLQLLNDRILDKIKLKQVITRLQMDFNSKRQKLKEFYLLDLFCLLSINKFISMRNSNRLQELDSSSRGLTNQLQGSKQIQSTALLKQSEPEQCRLDNQSPSEKKTNHASTKLTLPTEPILEQKNNKYYQQKEKSYCFSNYIHNVIKNRRLCRRGPFDLPLANEIPVPKRKPAKTDTGLDEEVKVKRIKLKTQVLCRNPGLKLSWERLKERQDREKNELPSLGSMRYNGRQLMPIKVEKYISKSLTQRSKLSLEQGKRLKQNILQRKLDVELINYEVLTKLMNN